MPDFAGDHMEGRSGGTGAGRFDAGVQRQEVGLLVDLADLTDELFDFLNILNHIIQQIDHAHRLLGQGDDVVDHVHQDFLHRDHHPLDRNAFAVQFHHIGVGDDFLHPPALLTRRIRQDPGSRC